MKELDEIRKLIDNLDTKIQQLLIERFNYISQIKEIKIQNNLPLLNNDREIEILSKINNENIKKIYYEILKVSKEYQEN